MKKCISLLALLFVSGFSFAATTNSVNFVTTLTSPQGIFSRMEAGDMPRIPKLNYCTKQGIDNIITVYHGSSVKDAEFTNFILQSGSGLRSEDTGTTKLTKWYFQSEVKVNDQSAVEVGRLLVGTLNLSARANDIADLKVAEQAYVSGDVYAKALSVDRIEVNGSLWFPKCYNSSGTVIECASPATSVSNVASWQQTVTGGAGSGIESCKSSSGSGAAASCFVLVF